MNPALWALAGAGVYLVVTLIVGAVVEVDLRDALVRVLLAPVGLVLGPLVWLALRVPGAGRFPLHRLRAEFDTHHHQAVGVAWHGWALVAIRRTGEKPPPPERVP